MSIILYVKSITDVISQDSVLGPSLFDIVINDLHMASTVRIIVGRVTIHVELCIVSLTSI